MKSEKIEGLLEDQSIPSIRNMNYFIVIAIFIVQLRLTTAVSPDLNTQQVFSSSELPSDVEIFSNYTFERLVQPEDCSYSNLTNCHFDEKMHFNYHLQCYSEVCPKERYYCLDKPNDNTVHICGKADKCHKRGRNIAVTPQEDTENIIVYSIPCRPGYAQMNGVNCFSPCVKDDTISVRPTVETDEKRALARCHAEEGYCNANRTTYFEIGSSEDECVVADDDLGIRCEKGEELMPDCSCVEKCESTDDRDWNDSLMCKPKEIYAVTMTDHAFSAKNTIIKTYTEITPKKEEVFFVSANEEKSEAIENNYKEKTDINKSNDSDSLTWLAVVSVVALVVILAIAVIAVLAIQRHRKGKEDGDQTTDQRDAVYKKNVVIKHKTVNNPTYIRVKRGNVPVPHPSLERLLPNQSCHNMDSHSRENDRPAHEHSDEVPMMQPLKTQEDGQNAREDGHNASDSGIYIEDETTARKTVQ